MWMTGAGTNPLKDCFTMRRVFREVERLLVHPGIKKKLVRYGKGDRSWLRRCVPITATIIISMCGSSCQPGSAGCKSQKATNPAPDAIRTLKWWFDVALAPKKKPATKTGNQPTKPKPKCEITLSSLPQQCRTVVSASSKSAQEAVYQAGSVVRLCSAPNWICQVGLIRWQCWQASRLRQVSRKNLPIRRALISDLLTRLPAILNSANGTHTGANAASRIE